MKTLIFSMVVVLVLFAVFAYFKRRSGQSVGSGDGPWPYVIKNPLSDPEQVLYYRLVESLPDHVVLSQVEMSRVLGVKRVQGVQGWFNRINGKSLDYLICTKDFKPLAAIELDDSSHNRPERVKADQVKNKAFQDAGLKLIRWNVKSLPADTDIRRMFEAAAI